MKKGYAIVAELIRDPAIYRSYVEKAPQGWRLVAAVAAVLSLMAAGLLLASPDVAGIRSVIRWTARTSLVLFLLTFIASAAWRRWPGPWTRWQLRNRRYLGLSFAVSHGLHLIAILAFAHLAPAAFDQASNPSTRFVGEIGYAFVFAMTATSFDTTAAWLGPRAWKILHRTGAWYLWLVFLLSYLSRAVHHPQYWVGVAAVLAALVVRTVPVCRVAATAAATREEMRAAASNRASNRSAFD
jgi:methionine sulfoxide reductase heme-binding subunit